jgi:fibronectin type 3 domain-containing protein
MKQVILLILFVKLIFFVPAAWAQPAGIKVIARAKADSVLLRWAPTSALAWEIANKTGYIIKRYTVFKEGEVTPNAQQSRLILANTVKPWPLEKWETIAKKDKYAAIAAQALYGKSFTLSNPSSNAIQFANQSAERDNRWSFALFTADQSSAAASAMGLRFVDRSIRKGEKYLYRVSVAHQNKDYPIDSGAVWIDPSDKLELPPPEEVKAEFGDQSVLLRWNTLYHETIYSSYKVERSDDEGKIFRPTDDLAFTTTRPAYAANTHVSYYMDSLPRNNKVYFYRVIGVTPFGEQGPPSEIVKGVGLGSANGVIAVVTIAEERKEGVYLEWRYPPESIQNISGFVIARSTSSKGPFKDLTPSILSINTLTFLDKKPGPINYYVVRAIGKDGKTTTSFPYMVQLEDNTPPKVPIELSGKINQQGMVTLQWKPNSESDLIGYRVFRSNSLHEEFVQITRDVIQAATYVDSISLNTLTRKVYYKVVASDNRYNLSDYSAPLTLTRPDIIPPAMSPFIQSESKGNVILLRWQPCSSDDVAHYELFRSLRGDTTRSLVKRIAKDTTSFTDKLIEPGTKYTYHLVVKDSAGLSSVPAKASVTCVDYGIRPAIAEILSKIDRENRRIILQWSYQMKNIRGFQLYRAAGESPLRLYHFLEANKIQFIDKEVRVNTRYTYQVRAIFTDGAESEMSKPLTINY